jgi:hypothetical protein
MRIVTRVRGIEGRTLEIADRVGGIQLRIKGRHGGIMADISFTRADLAAFGHELTRLYANAADAADP